MKDTEDRKTTRDSLPPPTVEEGSIDLQRILRLHAVTYEQINYRARQLGIPARLRPCGRGGSRRRRYFTRDEANAILAAILTPRKRS